MRQSGKGRFYAQWVSLNLSFRPFHDLAAGAEIKIYETPSLLFNEPFSVMWTPDSAALVMVRLGL